MNYKHPHRTNMFQQTTDYFRALSSQRWIFRKVKSGSKTIAENVFKTPLEQELVISLLWSSMTLYYQDNRIPYGLSYQRSQSDMIDQKWLKVLKPIKTCLWTPLIPQFKLIKCHTFPTCVFFRVDHKKLKSQRKPCAPLCSPKMNVFVEWAHRRSQEVVYTLGCPKKTKSLNFVSQLTPVVFIGKMSHKKNF